MNPPHVLGIPVDVTPPCPRNSSRRNPPSPSEFRDAARGMGMDIFWNHPMSTTRRRKTLHGTGKVVSTSTFRSQSVDG